MSEKFNMQEIITESTENEAFDIESLLKTAVSQNVSDIHLRLNVPPIFRKDGIIAKTQLPALTGSDMERVINKILPESIRAKAISSHDFDFSFEIPNVARFRVNLLHDLGHIGFTLRVIPLTIPSINDLFLPPVLQDFTTLNYGLVLVTGPTGSGKSTSLASMLDYLNKKQQKHVITLEDPIEFVHTNKKSIFTQRQLDIDTDSFPNGLKYALRQDPDVILIGEMRDRDTILSALKAAETGHLVFSTLHTTDAVQTINRIINAFEPHERESIRIQIAAVLQGTIAQKLVKRKDNKGRVPATEILVMTPAARDYVMKDQIDNIYDLIRHGDFNGMMSMNSSIYKLIKSELITSEEGLIASNDSNELNQMLKGAFHGTSSLIN